MTIKEVHESRNLEEDHGDLVNEAMRHGKTINGVRQCVKELGCLRKRSGKWYCRFNAPRDLVAVAKLHVDDDGKKVFSPVRNDIWCNKHSKLLLLAWRANCDLQLITEVSAVRSYIAKYPSKSEVETVSYKETLAALASSLDPSISAYEPIRKVLTTMVGERDISSQGCINLLLKLPLVNKTREVVSLSAQLKTFSVLRSALRDEIYNNDTDQDEDDDVSISNFWKKYNAKKEKGCCQSVALFRKIPKKDLDSQEYERFCISEVILYQPFRSVDDLLKGGTWEEAFAQLLSRGYTVQNVTSSHETYDLVDQSNEEDEVEEAPQLSGLNALGAIQHEWMRAQTGPHIDDFATDLCLGYRDFDLHHPWPEDFNNLSYSD